MKYPGRMIIFFLGSGAMVVLYVLAFVRIPGPEAMRSQYRNVINQTCVGLRHTTDAVTAVNFDYRGFDTLGEEFILFASVTGTLVLLRQEDEKKESVRAEAADPQRVGPASDTLRAWTLGMTGPTVVFGLYIIIHGQLSPGGGFQGGVILATAPLLIYLAESFKAFKRVTSHRWVEVAEAVGAGAYALIGLVGLFAGKEFLANVFPLGPTGEKINLLSGGTIPAISLATGIEVAAGFTLVLYAFLQEAMASREGDE